MEETKTENDVGVDATQQMVAAVTGVREMEFSYSAPDSTDVFSSATPTDARFLETESPVRPFNYHMTSTYPSGSYGDVPILVTKSPSTRGPKGPLVCLVEGCQRDLSSEKKYYKRYGMCMEHLKMNAIFVDGKRQRFCQQCGRFQELSEFDGDKRNCRERLIQHNMRRRKPKRDAGGSDGSWDDWSHDQRSGKAQKGRRSKRLMEKTGPSALWTPEMSHPYSQTPVQLLGASEGHKGGPGLTSEAVEMVEGVPITRLDDEISVPPYNQFAEELGLTSTDQQTQDATTQEQESLYNMVVHNVLPPGSLPESNYNHLESIVSSSGEESGNLTTLLHTDPPPVNGLTHSATNEEPTGANFPFLTGMGMLQSVRVSTAGGGPTVPMLVFPSASGATQVNALAIIPTAITSGQTLVPLPWNNNNPDRQQNMSMPVQSMNPIESPITLANHQGVTNGGQGEIPPLVGLALSASGIGQINGTTAAAAAAAGTPAANNFQSMISANQLAQFQMLIARQMSFCQGMETTTSSMIPQQETERQNDETRAEYNP
eukprot:g8913.t1